MLENLLAFFKHYPEFSAALGAGLIIFTRILAFMFVAPVISRKDIPITVKVGLALILTVSFIGILHPDKPPAGSSLILSLTLNATMGAIIGAIANMIFLTVSAAGDTINMQMGLSASMMFDPNTREQTSHMGIFFALLGTVIFIDSGGFYWLFNALIRSFHVFPIYGASLPLVKIININYLSEITSNVLFIGLQIAAPVLLATLAMDVILGIISKIAPQINVFQLSFLFKPVLGIAVLVLIMPVLVNVITDYFTYYSRIF